MVQPIDLNAAASPGDDPTHAFHAVDLAGHCSVKGAADAPCRIMGLAFDSGIALSTAEASFADEVILALPHLGLQKGVVSRVFDGGFEVHFTHAAYPKLWAYLSWLDDPDQEGRGYERIVPIRKLVGLERKGEPRTMARIIDLSRSGVALTTTQDLWLGEPIKVGRHAARVSRLFEGGAAAEFDAMIPSERFGAMIDLDAA